MARGRLNSLREFLSESHVTDCARRLLGCEIACGRSRIRVVEAEAYGGGDDLGSHACRGMTPRNGPMFGEAGHAYVYFTYGNHWMLNVTCRPEGEPGAVLIRGAVPLAGVAAMRKRRPKAVKDEDLLSGPGKIAAALGLNGKFSGEDMLGGGALRLIAGEPVVRLLVGRRVGLSVGNGDEKLWRFIDEEHEKWASKPRIR